MIIDFHVHGKISRSYPFNKEQFLLAIEEAKEYGLDSLVITEHFNADNFLECYDFLKSNYNLIKDYFNVNGFKIFYGMEVTTKQNLDILFIAKPYLILNLRKEIFINMKDDEYIDINTLFKLNISDEVLIILAHPYRNHIEFPKLERYIIEKIDALELNSKDIYKYGMEEMQRKVSDLSKKFKLPITSGSDTHYFIQISTAKNILNKNCETVKEIKEEIKNGACDIKFSEDLKIRVKCAIIIKKLICKK